MTIAALELAFVALLAALAIAALARMSFASRLADRPNERSLHVTPRVRAGGLGMAIAVAAFAPLHWGALLRVELACALFLVVVSALDDVRSLPVWLRLSVQAVAACVALYFIAAGLGLPHAAWAAPIALLAIVWMTNLFNFMDGADGLAGGMAAIGFGAYAAAALMAGDASLAWVAATIAAASVGFLAHNFPPARVFMGDAGSVPLGFLAGVLGLHGVLAGRWPAAFPVLVFAPFIVDASVTIARRALRREAVWRAHRTHAYQRLVLSGWSHRKLALRAYALMAAGAASALATVGAGPWLQCAIISVWAAAYALLLVSIERHVRSGDGVRTAPGHTVG